MVVTLRGRQRHRDATVFVFQRRDLLNTIYRRGTNSSRARRADVWGCYIGQGRKSSAPCGSPRRAAPATDGSLKYANPPPSTRRSPSPIVDTTCLSSVVEGCAVYLDTPGHKGDWTNTHPRKNFEAHFLDNGRECEHGAMRLRKDLDETLPKPAIFVVCVSIILKTICLKNRPRGCVIFITRVIILSPA